MFFIQDMTLVMAGRRSKHTTPEENEQFRKRMREHLSGPSAESQEIK
jgi:hypothetical protein